MPHGALLSCLPNLPFPHSSKPPWPHWGAWSPPWDPISHQSPPAAPNLRATQWEASPTGLQCHERSLAEATQAPPTAERLTWPPSLEGDNLSSCCTGETGMVGGQPVVLFCSSKDTSLCLLPIRGGTQPSWAAVGGWHCHPPSQGCPSAAGPAVGWPRHQPDTGDFCLHLESSLFSSLQNHHSSLLVMP